MKTLLPFLLSVLVQITLSHKTYTCEFHKYQHSNHYKTKVLPATHFLQNQKHKQQHNEKHHHKSQRRMLYGAGRPAMRITLNTDDLDTVKAPVSTQPQTTVAKLNFLKKAMFVTQSFFMSRLKVTSQGTLSIPSTCYDYPTPDTIIGASDLHIYVIYVTDSSAGYGATGVSCQWKATSPSILDPTLSAGRPTVGRIKFNTYNIIDSQTTLTNRLFATVTATCIHETIHILGFDPSLYSTYLDSNTGLPYAQVIQSRVLHASRTGGANYMMITPAVSAWALSHYGCATIPGMPLQNQDGNAVGAHWERLSIYDELMTGTKLGAQKPITALTFAILKDMGWYGVDDTFNDTTNYGYQKGCSFLTDACYGTGLTTYPKYFCNPTSYTGVTQCSSTFTGKATCSNQAALMADGCGMFKQYFHCVDPNSVGDFYQSHTLQAFGTSNFCFKGLIAMSGIQTTYRSRCYPMTCDYATTTITFTIGPYTVNCFSNEQGQNKTVTGMQNSIQCPIFSDFCTLGRKICPNWCSGNGFCTRGICNCYSTSTITYSGADCSITTCTGSNFYDTVTSSCVPSCSSGYYANTQSKSCLRCDSSCNQCRDQATICTSCISTPTNPQYYYVALNTCVSQCPSITFLQVDSCILCDATTAGCLTCSGSSTNCLSCVNSLHYLNQFGNCGLTCSISPYSLYDDVSKVCRQSCPNTLYLSSGHCISCNPNYRIVDDTINQCVVNCTSLSGYYQDDTNYICGKCNQTCRECVGSYAENCTSCWSNRTEKYQHLKMCVGVCPDGFYADDGVGKCQKCIVSLYCSTCHVVSTVVKCKTCKYGYYLQPNSTCMLSCDPTFYKNQWNHSCDACHGDCRDCNGPYQSSCLNCVSPKYFLRNSTGGYCLSTCPPSGYVTFLSTTCLACHQTCLTCINETSTGCATCASGLYLESNRCRYVCSPLKYADSATGQCLACDSKCKYCYGSSSDNCSQCQTGYVLNNFTCTTSCPEGQTANAYSVCEKKTFQSFLMGLIMLLGLIISLIY